MADFPQVPDDIFIAERFAAFTLLTPRNVSKPPFATPRNVQRFGSASPSPQPCEACLSFNHGREKQLVPKPYHHGGSEAFHEYQPRKPVQLQAQFDVFLEARARVLQRLKQEVNYNRLRQNRLPPRRGSGFAKLSEGTGVFHPRVSNANSDTAPTFANAAFAKNKQVMRHDHDEQRILAAEKNSIAARTSLRGNDDINYRLTPELSLPKDWTY